MSLAEDAAASTRPVRTVAVASVALASAPCPTSCWTFEGQYVSPLRPFNDVADGSWFTASRGAHSEKPALFADLIERMSPGPYVELFARQPRLGWDHWGHGYELNRTA